MQTIPEQRQKEEAVVLMGHGTHPPSNAFHEALMFPLQLQDPNLFVGTVEGYPGSAGFKKVVSPNLLL